MEYEILNYITDRDKITEEDLNEVNKLYIELFPDNERDKTLEEILSRSEEDNRLQLLIMKADPLNTGKNEVVAFDIIILDKDFVYTVVLGAKKQYGIKMYGKILGSYANDVLGKGKYCFFIAEKVEETAENYNQRRKRKAFFKRNGYIDTGYEYEMYGINYEWYVKGEIPSVEEAKKATETVIKVYYNQLPESNQA